MDNDETDSSEPKQSMSYIAGLAGVTARTIRRRAEKKGLKLFRSGGGKSAPYLLGKRDADELIAEIKNEEISGYQPGQDGAPTGVSGVYAVEVPAYDGSRRVKIGWSDNTSERLNTYRSIVPDLKTPFIWRTGENWSERMALKWAGKNGNQISQSEVFEFPDIDAAIGGLDDLFANFDIKR